MPLRVSPKSVNSVIVPNLHQTCRQFELDIVCADVWYRWFRQLELNPTLICSKLTPNLRNLHTYAKIWTHNVSFIYPLRMLNLCLSIFVYIFPFVFVFLFVLFPYPNICILSAQTYMIFDFARKIYWYTQSVLTLNPIFLCIIVFYMCLYVFLCVLYVIYLPYICIFENINWPRTTSPPKHGSQLVRESN